jgi:hypothetical protein
MVYISWAVLTGTRLYKEVTRYLFNVTMLLRKRMLFSKKKCDIYQIVTNDKFSVIELNPVKILIRLNRNVSRPVMILLCCYTVVLTGNFAW